MTEPKQRLSPEEYLARERVAEVKSEYLAGETFLMSGASRKHGLVTLNIAASLHGQLRDRPCEIFAADMRVEVTTTELFTYPDVVVVRGEPRFRDADLDTLLNPTLIVEVLSPSTSDYDRGTKFAHYRSLPSLREYLLFAQERVHAEQYTRQDGERWLLAETSDPEAVLDLPSVGCTLTLADVYAKVPLAG